MARQTKSVAIPVRVTPDDKLAIEKAAAHEEMTTSEYMRAAALTYMALTLNKHALNTALTGAKDMLRELEQEGKAMFFGKKAKV